MTRNEIRIEGAFEKLLEWLGPDREEAAQKYERVRLRLIKWFMCNGCGDDAEHLADRAIDRVMRKLEAGEVSEPYVGDKALYFLAFANHLRHEHFRERKPHEIPPVVLPSEEIEVEDSCLEECMATLEEQERWLAIEYYSFEKPAKIKHRKKLAEQFGMSLAGLRSWMHRIREKLRPCIEVCLDRLPSH